MKADEAADLMDRAPESDRFKQRAAMIIAVLAMILAIAGLGGSNAGKDAVNSNVLAANFYSFYQAKAQRQAALAQAVDGIELGWLTQPGLPEPARAALTAKRDQYKATIARYDSEPATREGKTELLAQAREHEAKRDRALKQDPYFDYAEALLQIAIVLISVAIIANAVWLVWLGGALGLIGALLTVNGFLLLVEIPGLA